MSVPDQKTSPQKKKPLIVKMHFGPQKTSFDQIKLFKNPKIMLENRFFSAKMHFY